MPDDIVITPDGGGNGIFTARHPSWRAGAGPSGERAIKDCGRNPQGDRNNDDNPEEFHA